jgi:Flp pilus assembly pilin Flp
MKKIFRKIVLICLILINFIANAQQVPSYVPSSGLVGWWPFSGNAIDSSGNGNNGTVNGATLTTDRFGISNKAYFFDGFNDNISLSRINVSQAVTLSVWVKNKKTSGYWRGIVTTQNNNTQGFLLQDASGSLKYDWTVSNGNGYYDLYNSTLIDTSKWVHIVGVITSDSMMIYYNGNLESERAIGSRSLASTANLWFGSRYSSEYFNGKLDDIAIWNRALTSSEIAGLYTANYCTTTSSTDTIISCGAYTWSNGVTYTSSNNTAKDTFVNAAGCDSIVTLNLTIFSSNYIQVGSDIDGEAVSDNSGVSVSLSSDGSILAIGANFNNGNGTNAGHVRVYKSISGTWTQVGSDIDGENGDDRSGCSVSLSSDGSTLAIGAYRAYGSPHSLAGHVRVYKNVSGTWTQVGSDIDGEAGGDQSGWSVSLSSDGSIVAIGAFGNDGNGLSSGHVRVYKNISGTWTQVGSDIDGEAGSDNSGNSVSLSSDGSTVAIGARLNAGNGRDAGHVRVYKNISGTWTQVGSDIDGEAVGDQSGRSVSLSSDGSVVAIGGDGNDGNGTSAGHVRVYKNISGTWTQLGSDIDGEAGGDQSGWSVSLSSDGSILAIGAFGNDGNGTTSGHVRIYKNISGTWTQVDSDIEGESVSDASGMSVSLSSDGSTVAIGAPGNDGNGYGAGHVRVYNIGSAITSSTDTITSCGPYTWTNGVTYTTSNSTATDTFVNALGCDSIVTLNLTVLPPSTIYIGSSNISSDTVICSNQNITLRYDTSNQTSSGSAASISGYAFLGSYGVNNYYVSNSASNWSTANQSAISNGGHLADISSSGENSFLASKISTYSWIGYNDVASEGSFVWSSGSQSTYTNWRSSEPSNSGGNEDHTILWPNQEWSDWNGSTYHILEVSTISVLWSTGETSIEINVSPDTSTVYWVSSGGCRDSVTITVQDIIKPTVVTQNLTVSLDASGGGSITATQVDNGSTDNCAIATRTLSKSSFDCSDVGANTIWLRVTDANGNIDSASAVITVQDVIKPTVVTQNLTVSLDATGSGSITATQVDNGSTDNCTIATRTLSKSSFDCSEVGANTIYLIVTDANGNIDSTSAVVTVQDIIKPTVVTQNLTVSLDASGAGSVTVADIDNGSTDNCTIASRTLSKRSFDCSEVGANTIYLVVTDVNGNIDSASAVITVQDTIKPTVLTQNVTVSLDASGAGSVTVADIDNGSTDNCTIASRTLSKTSFDCSEVGANTIYLIVTDVNGNIDSASAVVTVQDIIKPTVLTQNVTVSLDASGAGSVTVADIDNGSTDNCSIATRTLSKSSFDCSEVGANTIWLRVTDVNGNIDSASAVVTVQDITKPTVVTTPSDIALGYCDATYTYAIPTGDDNCGVTVTQIAGLPPGSTFPVGLTVNTFEISDPSGNTVTTSFTVDIRARYMPFTNLDISLCNNNSKIDMTKGFDNIIFIGSGVEANEKFFNPNSLEPGSYSITAEFADSMGCVSTEQFIIEVRSTPVVPRIERVASDQIITAQAYGNYQWYRNGEELEGEDKQLLRVHELGIYSVLVGNDENCFEASEGYGFGIPVNEENVTNKGLVKVFPNPTRDVVFVQINDEIEFHLLTLSDAVGNKLIERETSTKVVKLDLTSLAPGTYYLNVLSGTTNETVEIVRL